MNKIIMVTGGARSGKSTFAENQVKELAASRGDSNVIYLATATCCDDEMAERIAKHRESRPQEWITIEKYRQFCEFEQILDEANAKVILLDCMGFMLNNIMFADMENEDGCDSLDFEKIEKEMIQELQTLSEIARRREVDFVAVTNEVGMALVPPDKVSRYYRDMLGRANSAMARISDEVYFIVSGLPMKIK